MNVLLTGISGFIAKAVALEFLNAGHSVRGSLRRMDRADEVRDALRPHLESPPALDRLSFVELDLTRDGGWQEAAEGMEVVVHTASPFPMAPPKDIEADLIRPAVEGTLRALRAAKAAGVRRVVLTSSMAAVMNRDIADGAMVSAEDWSEIGHPTLDPYSRSKTEAERAARRYADENGLEIVTINPGLVLGTPLDRHWGTSLDLVERILAGKDPAVPDLGFPVVDVADVARMHLAAAERDAAAGGRYLGAAGWMTMLEMARLLAAEYPDRKIATRKAPGWLIRGLSYFDKSLKTVAPQIGRTLRVDATATKRDLGIAFAPPATSVRRAAAAILAA